MSVIRRNSTPPLNFPLRASGIGSGILDDRDDRARRPVRMHGAACTTSDLGSLESAQVRMARARAARRAVSPSARSCVDRLKLRSEMKF